MKMIIDGRKIAEEMREELQKKFSDFFDPSHRPIMAVVYVGDDAVIENFTRIKKKFGNAIGIAVEVFQFDEHSEEKAILEKIEELNIDNRVGGIVVQLPLPKAFEKEKILDAVAPEKDIDVLKNPLRCSTPKWVSPVAGAVKKIFEIAGVDPARKRALVVGKGRLVGGPLASWLKGQEARVASVEKGEDFVELAKEADIIVTGAGSPGIITPDIIQEGCVLIDAGTSEEAGELRGDANSACAEKCSVFTPVPGGIGPITVACLFSNLFLASSSAEE